MSGIEMEAVVQLHDKDQSRTTAVWSDQSASSETLITSGITYGPAPSGSLAKG